MSDFHSSLHVDTHPSSAVSTGTSPFVELFRARAKDTAPSKHLLVGPETLTYGQALDRVARLATFFRDRGLACGDRGVIVTADEVAVTTLFLGMLGSGITPIVLDSEATEAELHVLLAASDALIVFLDENVIARLHPNDLKAYRTRIVRLAKQDSLRYAPQGALGASASTDGEMREAYPAMLSALTPALSLPADIPAACAAYILFTSGTTSTPKGVEVSHGALFTCYKTMSRQFGYSADSRILNVLPIFHADGLSEGVVMTFFCGATLHRPIRFAVQQIPALLDTVHREHITHFHATPTMLALIDRACSEDLHPFATTNFHHVISSGGPLPEALWRRFEDRFQTQIVNVYGLTEAARELLYSGPDEVTRKVGTNGKPVGCEARIIGDDGCPLARGKVGELVFRSVNFMTGYFRRPEETAAVLRDGWLYTGDLAVEDADGFYSIIGRKKNVIITGGLNVYPEDISRTISRMPGVADVVTLGIPDETWGERVVSCIVANQPAGASADDVIAYCRTHLSKEKLPSHVLVLDELPRGPTGKVALPQIKKLIAETLEASQAGTASPKFSGSEIASRVLELAARCFKTPVTELSLDSEPETTAGWNSLAHIEFILSLETEFGIKISPAEMLSIVTLGDAVEFINSIHSNQEGRHRP